MASASTSQPIALPAHSPAAVAYHDYQMADGSYTGSSGPFNPASYTRHFLGSPISWRPSSFNAGSLSHRPHDSPLYGSIECVLFASNMPCLTPVLSANEMRYGRTPSSSLETRDSLLNALNLFDREGELVPSFSLSSPSPH